MSCIGSHPGLSSGLPASGPMTRDSSFLSAPSSSGSSSSVHPLPLSLVGVITFHLPSTDRMCKNPQTCTDKDCIYNHGPCKCKKFGCMKTELDGALFPIVKNKRAKSCTIGGASDKEVSNSGTPPHPSPASRASCPAPYAPPP